MKDLMQELFLNPTKLVGFICPTKLVGFICPIKLIGFILSRPRFSGSQKSSIKLIGLILSLATNFLKLIR